MNTTFEALEAEYRKQIQAHPYSHAAYLALAKLYFEHHAYEEALGFFKKVMEQDATLAEPYLKTGEIHFLQGAYPEARQNFLKALEIEPENADVLNNLGVVLLSQNQYAEAETRLREALAVRPDFFDASFNLGTLYVQAGRFREALPILERASALNPDSTEVHDLLKACRAALGETANEQKGKEEKEEMEGWKDGRMGEDNLPFFQPSNLPVVSRFTFHASPDISRKVTLYFPCYNAEATIGDCLEGALKQTYPIDEILVIDDGSTDGSIEIASQYPVKIIRHEGNLGLAAARNTAIRSAKGDFIAALDSDCVPEPNWLEALMANFTSEDIIGVGGKLIEAHTRTVADLWRSIHLHQHWGDEKIVNPPFLFGANTVYRKDAMLSVGLYDEAYRTNYEDCDLFARLQKLNGTMVYEPFAQARHLRRDKVPSAVNTLWNWHQPLHQKNGYFDDFEKLAQKIDVNMGLSAQYLGGDSAQRKFQILYPSLLMAAYHALLDLKFYHRLQSTKRLANPLEIIEQTFDALIILATWTAKQKSPETELYQWMGEDLLTIQLKPSRPPSLNLEELLERAKIQNSSVLDMKKYPSLHGTYLHHFLNGFLGLFDKINDPRLMKMLEVSAKGGREEKEGREGSRAGPIHRTEHGSPVQKEGKPGRMDGREGRMEGWKDGGLGPQSSNLPSFHPPNQFLPTFQPSNHSSSLKVVLANPPWRKGNRYGVRAGEHGSFTMDSGDAPIPGYIPFPFFMAIATSLLKKHGIEALLVDAIAEGLTDEEFIHRVRGYMPDLILIQTATAFFDVDLKMAERLKAVCNPVSIALSGTHATVMKESLLKEHEGIDFILYGEYEFTILGLVGSLQNGAELETVQGLAFRRDGEVLVTPQRPLVENLDELPWPERVSLPMYNYNDPFAGVPYPNVQVMASRGCPYQWPQILYDRTPYRTRDPKDVVDEIEWLIDYYGFKAFYFDDDTFNIGKKRTLAICDEIKKRGMGVPWSAMARADTSDHETLKAMADAGLFAIKFGVESGDPEIVDHCGRKLDLSKVRDAVDDCKALGVQTHLTFTFGLPGETKETIQKTINFAIELDPDSVQFSLTTPFPGTQHYDMLDEQGLLLSKDWKGDDGAMSTVIPSFGGAGVGSENLTQEELEGGLKEANQRWLDFVAFKEKWKKVKGLRGMDAIEHLSLFTGEPQEAVIKKVIRHYHRTAEAFQQAKGEIEQWYRETDAYLYELIYWEIVDDEKSPFARKVEGDYLLDYGCGVGTYALEIARSGKLVDAYDISLKQREFLKFRSTLDGVEDYIRILESEAELGVYDSIICLHVLEHLHNPLAKLKFLSEHLKSGGLIYLVAPFDLVGPDFPEHLPENKDIILRDLVTQIGLDVIDIAQLSGFELIVGQKFPKIDGILKRQKKEVDCR